MLNRQLILVAIDHATDMKRAIDVAHRVAKERGADVDVIQILPRRGVRFDDRPGVRPVESHDSSVSMGARLASMLRSGDHDGVHVRSVTLRGTPEQVIPAYIQLHQATLLVVQRDYGSSRFWRNGRVVDDLARQSPVPLLVLPKRERFQRDREVRRILAPVDFSIASAVALRTAANLSRRQGARVTVAHALTDVPRHMVFSGSEAWEVTRRLAAQLDAVAGRLRRKAAFLRLNDFDTEIATGDAERAILEMAARTDADLIVMGVAHRSWLDRMLFGSTLRRVLRRSTVPVLVVPVVAGAYRWPDERGFNQLGSSVWAELGAGWTAA
jgi:nucleotide-binding universal stress UspA family protein